MQGVEKPYDNSLAYLRDKTRYYDFGELKTVSPSKKEMVKKNYIRNDGFAAKLRLIDGNKTKLTMYIA